MGDRHGVRVAIVSECFLPVVNGVTNSVLRVVEHLTAGGHEVLVIAPGMEGPTRYHGARVVRIPSVDLPVVSSMPVGVPSRRVLTALREFRPDVVHLAAPFVVGYRGLAAARRLGVPTVAVYQTDVAGFASSYGLGLTARAAWRWTCRLHTQADRTLAPSTWATEALRARGVPRVHQWGRGVDTSRFTPSKRDPGLRARLARDGELLVGYVGRLAPEKQVERLAALRGMPGVRLVVVGDGPSRPGLQAALPDAEFLGFRDGDDLARHVRVAGRVRAHRPGGDVLPGRAGGAGLRGAGRRAGRRRAAGPRAARPHRVPGAAAAGRGARVGPGVRGCRREAARRRRGTGGPGAAPQVRRGRAAVRPAPHLVRGLRRARRALRGGARTADRHVARRVKIVQLANFYGPRSGGLRTALHHLGAGYVARGHQVVLVVPGPRAAHERLPSGIRRITVPAPLLPGTGGYRAVDPWRVQRLLERLRPDAIEVSDRLTLRGLGTWASRRGVPGVVISHERLDRLLAQFLLPEPAGARVADLANARMAAAYDTVVATTAFARAEFDRIGAANVVRVPLGVDLAAFSPRHRDPALRARLAADGRRAARALRAALPGEAPRAQHRHRRRADAPPGTGSGSSSPGTGRAGPRWNAARPTCPSRSSGSCGSGRCSPRCSRPRTSSLAPGPHETFGLSALEALACGTPVVVSASSALPEIVGPARAALDSPAAFAAGVTSVLAAEEAGRRRRPGPAPSATTGRRRSAGC